MTSSISAAGRLFLAIPLTPVARDSIGGHLNQHLGSRPLPGRAVVPANWHITLRFLGETETAVLEALRRQLEPVRWPPAFEVVFGSIGAFPRTDRARVLWLGLERGADDVGRLAEIGEAAAVASGFAPEFRPYHGHLTLSRLERPADVQRLIESVPAARIAMRVESVVLFRSHLGRRPASYEPVARWMLVHDHHEFCELSS